MTRIIFSRFVLILAVLITIAFSSPAIADYVAGREFTVKQPDGSFRIEPVPTLTLSEDESSVDLGKIDIVGDTLLFTQDTIGYNDVFDKNISRSAYRFADGGKEFICL